MWLAAIFSRRPFWILIGSVVLLRQTYHYVKASTSWLADDDRILAGYAVYRGSCSLLFEEDLTLPRRQPGALSLHDCQRHCNRAPHCSAVEWHEETRPTARCHLVLDVLPAGVPEGRRPYRAHTSCLVRGGPGRANATAAGTAAGEALTGHHRRHMTGTEPVLEASVRASLAAPAISGAVGSGQGPPASDRSLWSDTALFGWLPTLLPHPDRAAPGHFRRLGEESRQQLQSKIDNQTSIIKKLENKVCELREELGRPCQEPQDAKRSHSGGNDTATSGPTERHKEDRSWTWEAWVFLILFTSICGGCQLFSCIWCTFISRRNLKSDLPGMFTKGHNLVYMPLSNQNRVEMEAIGQLLQREMRLKVVTPLLGPLLCAHWTTCERGPPWWGYAIMLPILARSKHIEWCILKKVTKSGWRAMCTFNFLIGTIDHLDWFMDGLFPVHALRCEPRATDNFVRSLKWGVLDMSVPAIQVLHFSGLTILALTGAMLVQQTFGSMGKGVSGMAASADVACFGAVTDFYSGLEPEAEKGLVKVMTTFSKVLLRNTIQLWLQASFFGIMFTHLKLIGKVKILLTMLLGVLGAIFKTRIAATVTCQQFLAACRHGRRDLACIVVTIFLVQIFSWLMVFWTIVKVYKSFTCRSNMWNIYSGCVPGDPW